MRPNHDSGGQESQCGWCKEKWDLNWQITPVALTKGTTDPNPEVAKRVFAAMRPAKKIDIAAIKAARHGYGPNQFNRTGAEIS